MSGIQREADFFYICFYVIVILYNICLFNLTYLLNKSDKNNIFILLNEQLLNLICIYLKSLSLYSTYVILGNEGTPIKSLLPVDNKEIH